jgi:hypothetical protein
MFPELPENSPRYVVLLYELNHKDGRKSFPPALVNWVAPTASEISLLTLHASALINFQTAVSLLVLPPLYILHVIHLQVES